MQENPITLFMNAPLDLQLAGLTLLAVPLVAFWNLWIFHDANASKPEQRPNLLQFYGLGLRNLFRLATLRRPLSHQEAYPALFPVAARQRLERQLAERDALRALVEELRLDDRR